MELPLVHAPASLWRVHPQPPRLPAPPREDERPPNRFDDPHRAFVVRYTAATLRGCLLECSSRWRHHQATDERRRAVTGVHEDHQDSRAEAIGAWLAQQRVGQLSTPRSSRFVDVNDPRAQQALAGHPDVRQALELVKEAQAHVAPELDEATIRLSGPLGRGVTQAVARAIYDEHPRPDGVAYRSRLDDSERLWAIYGFVEVTFHSDEQLSREDPDHVAAVSAATALWGLPLPPEWTPGSTSV